MDGAGVALDPDASVGCVLCGDAMIRGPKDGYDFSRKRNYRRQVWATFRKNLKQKGLSIKDSHALLMPSLEGEEIDVALNAGFREQNLHIVDDGPAVVATLKRRYPRINTYGVTASRAVERIARKGIRLRCLNLDFCGNLSGPFASELLAVALCGSYPVSLKFTREGFTTNDSGDGNRAFDDVAFVAISTLRGREHPKTSQCLKAILCSDDHVTEALEYGHELFDSHLDEITKRLDGYKVPEVVKILRKLPVRDRQRALFMVNTLGLEILGDQKPEYRPMVRLIRGESYVSSNGQSMLWGVCEVESFHRVIAQRLKADAIREAKGIAPIGWAGLEDLR